MAYPYLQDLLKDLFGLDIWLPIPTFGTMFALGVMVVLWIFHREVKRMESVGILPSETKDAKPLSKVDIELWAVTIIGGILGARLLAISENIPRFLNDPIHVFFRGGGLAVLGSLIGGGLAAFLWLRRTRFSPLVVFDAGAPALILGFAVGRIGCQLSGDGDWGIPADMSLKPDWLPTWFWAQTYEHNVLGKVIPSPGVYPTSVYESVLALVTFAILWSVRKHRFASGWTFSLLLVLGGIERFLIEGIRVNIRYSFLGVEVTQAEMITFGCIIVGICGLVYASRKSTILKTQGTTR